MIDFQLLMTFVTKVKQGILFVFKQTKFALQLILTAFKLNPLVQSNSIYIFVIKINFKKVI